MQENKMSFSCQESCRCHVGGVNLKLAEKKLPSIMYVKTVAIR